MQSLKRNLPWLVGLLHCFSGSPRNPMAPFLSLIKLLSQEIKSSFLECMQSGRWGRGSPAAAGGYTSVWREKWKQRSPLRGLLAQNTNQSPWEVKALARLKCLCLMVTHGPHAPLCSCLMVTHEPYVPLHHCIFSKSWFCSEAERMQIFPMQHWVSKNQSFGQKGNLWRCFILFRCLLVQGRHSPYV